MAVARTRPLPLRKQLLYAHHRHLLASSQLALFLRPAAFSADEYRQLRAQLPQGLTLTLLRPGLLPALLRDHPAPASWVDTTYLADPSHLQGPLAVLTADTLDPPTLAKALALVRHVSRQPPPNAPPAPEPAQLDRLAVLSALVEHTAADPARADHVSRLPPLDVLRAQLVGLVAAPASRIARVLGARATDVARTLDGFRQGLADEQQAAAAPPQAQA
ncbi:hypothetical protein JCM3770_001519 [Rhodotorula araucariae]